MLDAKLIKQSANLLQLAPEVPRDMALDLYIVSLDKMIAALPLETDPQAKAILWKKLQDITSRYQLDAHRDASDESKDTSDLVVRAAIALKASPIPDFMHWILSSMLQGICRLDKKLCIRQHVWTMASKSITKMIDLDHQYHLHHTATRLVYTGFTTLCKACVAYTEAPSYNEIKKHA
ncbi:hypothetical protein K492DRAFT_227447 [Lichtheimia hyalospora FSU 10163]|nr:hypothetical protein K492DRAFT_227447 [Lichtheimia hyalospora FSU 10163]